MSKRKGLALTELRAILSSSSSVLLSLSVAITVKDDLSRGTGRDGTITLDILTTERVAVCLPS